MLFMFSSSSLFSSIKMVARLSSIIVAVTSVVGCSGYDFGDKGVRPSQSQIVYPNVSEELLDVKCDNVEKDVEDEAKKKLNIIMIGAPASGKGVHSGRIMKQYNLCHISLGDVIRDEIKNNTSLGNFVKDDVQKGALVGDRIAMFLLSEQLNGRCKGADGIIYDGFPRSIKQVEKLEEMYGNSQYVNVVININAKDEELINRVRSRADCAKCNAKLLKDPQICKNCSGTEVMRADDDIEVFKERLRLHHSQSDPIIEAVKKSNSFKMVDVQTTGRDIQDVSAGIFQEIEKAIGSR